MAILGGYLDESHDEKRRRHSCFGGIIADVRQMDLLDILWIDATHRLVEPFHMTDCETGNGQFKTWTHADRQDLIKKLVSIIKQLKVWGCAATVSIEDYKAVFPDAAEFDPFYLSIKSAIVTFGYLADHIGREIDMWFEEGPHDAKIQEIHRQLKQLSTWRSRKRLLGITPRPKTFIRLQGADLYVRESFKHFDNLGIRAERKILLALKEQLMFHCWTLPALQELRARGGPNNLEAIASLEIDGHSFAGKISQ